MESSNPQDSHATEQRNASQVPQSSGSPGSFATEQQQPPITPWNLAHLPRISPVKANQNLIKAYRERLQRDTSLSVDVTDTQEWKRYVAHHPGAETICSPALCSAKLVRVMDEWDHNHSFEVVDLVLERVDGTHVRLHPSKPTPYGVRFGRFSSKGTAGFGLWMETSRASYKTSMQPKSASASAAALLCPRQPPPLPPPSEASQPSATAPRPSPSASSATSDTLLQSTCHRPKSPTQPKSPSASASTSVAAPQRSPSASATTSDTLLQSMCDPHCKEPSQPSPSASSASTAPGPKPPPSPLSGTSAEQWHMYTNPETSRLWWYNPATNVSRYTLPSTWRVYTDPASQRKWFLDMATGASHMQPYLGHLQPYR